MTRVLAIMGSGETSPTMVATHRELIARAGPPAVLLDTPFGFQENADLLCAKAQGYFRESLGAQVEVASLRRTDAASQVELEGFLAQVRSARYVFAGPGSPTYALAQWSRTLLPAVLAGKLSADGPGGAVTFASAAALTLGVRTVPVYEIYKVGADPGWAEGLDLLAAAGLRAAVIPHYNNAEGQNHDTRYCYLGERRLAKMEEDLPEGAFVLGIDEHTGLVLDLDAGSAEVVGLGVVTVRSHGRSEEVPTGATIEIDELRATAGKLARSGPATAVVQGGASRHAPAGSRCDVAPAPAPPTGSPLLAAVRRHEAAFDDAMASGDVGAAVAAVLALDGELAAWSADTLQSDELDQGRSVLRSMVIALGKLAEAGARDPREALAPFVEELLALRAMARQERRFGEADRVRDRLVALGVEVHDSPAGTAWELRAGV